ncbi:hypothetical protein CsSME_00049594 [Camellia sinensis var. sinensis]
MIHCNPFRICPIWFISRFSKMHMKGKDCVSRLKKSRLWPAEEEDPTILYLCCHHSANPLPLVFTYEELESSTNRFDVKPKIRDGGFRSVYLD